MNKVWRQVTTSLTNQTTIKIKTHVNKQQLRPRALPKIDVHAHRHNALKRVRTTRPHSERKNQYFEQNYFPNRCCVGLQPAAKRPRAHLTRKPNHTLSVTKQSIISPIKCRGSWIVRVQNSAVPLRSIGWAGCAAAWRRPTTPRGRYPATVAPCYPVPVSTNAPLFPLAESWAQASLTLTSEHGSTTSAHTLPFSGALYRNLCLLVQSFPLL